MPILKDISDKIEPPLVDTVADFDAIAKALGIPYVLVGATARDLFFSKIFDIQTTRATADVDLAIRVGRWTEFQTLTDSLLAGGKFMRPPLAPQHRFAYKDSILVDVIPFGPLEQPAGYIRWPLDDQTVMSTVGFEEAFDSSILIRVRAKPELHVRICTPAALGIMKLVAWNDGKYEERTKHARDLLFLMKEYINAGNDLRLYEEEKDLMESKEFDYDLASPRILGRDIRKIASPGTLSALEGILEKETKDDSELGLVVDMIRGELHSEDRVENALSYLGQLKMGIIEDMSHGKH